MLQRDHVVDLEGKPVAGFGNLAILAASTRSTANKGFQIAPHVGSARLALAWDGASGFEGTAGFGLEDVDEMADAFIAIDLGSFLGAEFTFTGEVRQSPHAFLVFPSEVEGQDLPRQLGGIRGFFRL
ncbi:hypothetical protein [Paludisphaera borealis]|uniref:hypothetical protein n=1 Tax=Paludisphaera borealis TaxID=1387353 RepID=UPI001F20B4A8|nr:hypothetical protein [Paludisphaera borealis]